MTFPNLLARSASLVVCTVAVLAGCKARQHVGTDATREVPSGWMVAVAPKAGTAMLECAANSELEWSVTTKGRTLEITRLNTKSMASDSLPSGFRRSKEMQGRDRVVPFGDGYLVGFDGGEYGGGLWFSSRTDHVERTSLTENIRGLFSADGGTWVLSAADISKGAGGSLWIVENISGKPRVRRIAVLSSSPRIATKSGDLSLVIVKEDGVDIYTQAKGLRSVAFLPLQSLYPNSVALDSGGGIYIGMRLYVLHLLRAQDGYTYNPTWMLPTQCSVESENQSGCGCS